MASRTCVPTTTNIPQSPKRPLLRCVPCRTLFQRQMAEQPNSKWEGKTNVEIPNTYTEQAWRLLEDFCNLHRLMPIDTCYQVEDFPGQPCPVRYCASTVQGQGEDEATVMWAKEKLLALDPTQRCLTYEVVDNNIGFKSYVATIKVLPMGSDVDVQGCKIEWSFVSDPVEGWTFQDLISYIDSSLHFMANKMQQPCSAN